MSDIIDQIDELVDDSLARENDQPSDYMSGYRDYPECPHCGRHWHGLRITQQIADMYAWGRFDEDYVAAEDDSRVVCEGSDFIGPQRPSPGWTVEIRPSAGWQIIGTYTERELVIFQLLAEAYGRMNAAVWSLPDFTWATLNEWRDEPWTPITPDPIECPGEPPEVTIEFGPQNWGPNTEPPRCPWTFGWPSTLDLNVRRLWDHFTAIETHAPEPPGYDFSGMDLETPSWIKYTETDRR